MILYLKILFFKLKNFSSIITKQINNIEKKGVKNIKRNKMNEIIILI